MAQNGDGGSLSLIPFLKTYISLTTLLRYAIACIAYLNIVWQLVINGRAAARTKGNKVNTFFTAITGYTLLVWTAYPV